MNKVLAGTVNEFRKIQLRPKTVAVTLLAALIPGLMAIIAFAFQKHTGILVFGTADFPLWVLTLFTNVFLPLFIFMWVADSFNGEQEDGSLKFTLLRPISRFKVYLSKNLAILACISINLLVVAFFSIIAGFFLSILGTGFLSGLGRILAAYAVSILPLFILTVASVFLVQLVRGSSAALAIEILFYIGARALPILSPLAYRLTPAAYLDWYSWWLAPTVSWGPIANAAIALAAIGLILFPAGYCLFDRKDV